MTYGPGPHNFRCDNFKLEFPPRAGAAARIMAVVRALTPSGNTPLTLAVEHAAAVLDFHNKPGVIVVLTDGEDTCGGSPCAVGKQLHAAAEQLTIHVIGLQVEDYSWTTERSVSEARCLADQNNGFYITAGTTEELIAAFEYTLGCPMVTQHSLR